MSYFETNNPFANNYQRELLIFQVFYDTFQMIFPHHRQISIRTFA